MSLTNIILTAMIVLLVAYCARLKLYKPTAEDKLTQEENIRLHISSNDIMQYIKDTANDFIPLMESKGIDFSVKCVPESMMGWMDADKVDTILQLLLLDVSKGNGENRKVTLNASTNSSYEHVIIQLDDNGQQTSNIGTKIAHMLAHLQHGTLHSHYYEGNGNTIVLDLPIKKDAFQSDAATAADSKPSDFHIPTNIELNVPTITLPEGHEGEQPMGAILQQAYLSADQKYLQRAVQCVRDHITDSDYSREDFASDMGSSVSTLYNKIRALTGKNVTTFVRDIRIKTACRLAKENPDLRVSDIAYQVGFKDPKYFATSFKRVMGVQPKEYITQQRSAGR